MRSHLVLIALLGLGLACAQVEQLPLPNNPADVGNLLGGELAPPALVQALLEAPVPGVKAATINCAVGRPVPASKRGYAASVCIGEFQHYAQEQGCTDYPEYISSDGLKYYKMKVAPTCMQGGRYWCNVMIVDPCRGMERHIGTVESNTKPTNCEADFPSPGKRPRTRLDPGSLSCPGGWKRVARSIADTYLRRWLEDPNRGGKVVKSRYCTAVGFESIEISDLRGCTGNNDKGLVSQGYIKWNCAGSRRIHALSVRITDTGARFVCPWDTTINLNYWK